MRATLLIPGKPPRPIIVTFGYTKVRRPERVAHHAEAATA